MICVIKLRRKKIRHKKFSNFHFQHKSRIDRGQQTGYAIFYLDLGIAYLDGIFDISPDVDTRLHGGVSALPQKLARQSVQL